MTSNPEPTRAQVDAAALDLCPFCRQRAAGFLGSHEQHPHYENATALRLIGDLYRACCAPRITGRYGTK